MHVRDLTTHDEFHQVVELERRIWGSDYAELVPVPILIVGTKRGAILIGAFDETDRMVGFVYSFPGLKAARMVQWSHMLGVLEEHRGSGLGKRLKLEQRRRALQRGFDVIEWTFDPMQAVNANLNLHRLGAIVETYEENVYGDSGSVLHRGTPTDRFVAEWWIGSQRVEQRLAGPTDESALYAAWSGSPSINKTRDGNFLRCDGFNLSLDDPWITAEIPAGFSQMQQQDPALALEWRYGTRAMFTEYFARGYRAIDFLFEPDGARGRYLLTSATERD